MKNNMEKITYIKRNNTNQKGDLLVGKNGKPYVRVSLKVESKGDRYISGFAGVDNADWEVGDEVEMTITESTSLDKNGKPYLNFTTKKAEVGSAALGALDEKLEDLLNKVTGISMDIQIIKERLDGKDKKSYPKESNETAFDDFDPGSVPF